MPTRQETSCVESQKLHDNAAVGAVGTQMFFFYDAPKICLICVREAKYSYYCCHKMVPLRDF